MHRYDLFENEVENYIPFRKDLIKYSSSIAPSSKAGENHLKMLYPEFGDKVHVRMLGVRSIGKSVQLHDCVFRIITVSYIAPVKRLSILANALKGFTEPVEWTHLGDGPLKADLEQIIQTLPVNINVNLMGMVDSTKVQDILVNQPFNLFLNISESEGVPFSIMEALASGIPVMATDVGGTAEIIDDTVGRLLPKELTPTMLCNELINYNKLSTTEKEKKAENAYNRYLSHCDTEALTKKIALELKTLK
jgi:glycosyltransferase involved in cell wall biosynthesis